MILKRFNAQGIEKFHSILQQYRLGANVVAPLQILESQQFTETLATRVDIPVTIFTTRMELARSISDAVKRASLPDDMLDIGLWSWLSAAYFDTVCPIGKNGLRNILSDYRYIPSNSYKNFYRHLIRGPVRIYRLFLESPEMASIVLCQQPSMPGDFVEQLASRQERVTSRAVIGAATILYFDESRRMPRRGSAPNSRKPGTLRRYIDILDQLELTYDLYSISSQELLNLLPTEFTNSRFG